ncbi:50S ribosomal protein L17, chloroplastic [Vitis vinifera]|uniref:50S ribosomal protein L17, chloroplastic n=1 Tax=Vitis vinifera TaxID=29760 RepID=A0A438E083_VITVI|nr:50S ribosomal protein L17, chloroplastic [Vitis vinifera]
MACGSSASCTWSMATLRSALPSLPSLPCAPSRITLTRPKPMPILPSFTGLAPLSPLLSLSSPESTSFEHNFTIIDNGGRISAMRHGRRVPKLNRPPDQRRALLRGLTTQLLKYGRIKTTRARASAMRKYVDKMITLAKDGSLHKRRQALGFIYENRLSMHYLLKSQIGMGTGMEVTQE